MHTEGIGQVIRTQAHHEREPQGQPDQEHVRDDLQHSLVTSGQPQQALSQHILSSFPVRERSLPLH
ncbi:hypothetical protein PCLA_15r0151 [Pseudomonas citronellolis]|nr:hypothetical protein PCLA_15r0151 [Pseudomonas citronellolis]